MEDASGGAWAGDAWADGAKEAAHLDEYTEDTGRLLAVVAFFVFGNVFVLPAVSALSWQVALCGVLLLTVGRLLPGALSLIGFRAAAPTVLFVGWFGPRGLASILFGLLLVQREVPAAQEFFAVIATTVVASVLPSSNDNDDSLEEGGGGKRKKKVVILLSANRSQTIGVLL